MESTPKIPSIKLKLSLGSATPSTPTPAPAKKNKGKGKAAAVESNGVTHHPQGHTDANGTAGYSHPLTSVGKSQYFLEDEQPIAGPSSRPSLSPQPSTGPHGYDNDGDEQGEGQDEDVVMADDDYQPLDSNIVTPSRTPKNNATSTRKKGKRGKLTLSRSKKGRKVPQARPSAIPPHLRPEFAIATPSRSNTSLPVTPGSSDISVKLETAETTSPDPLNLSPSGANSDLPNQYDDFDTPSGRGKIGSTVKWSRLKKPFKELATKIIAELRRKDDYALFEDPVDLDAFPDYLGIVGGEDKMMDISTMQSKIDNGDYRGMDEFATDLQTLVEAAQKFNPPGSIPHISAGRILTHGLKHIDRARPLVRTPNPSPDRDSATPFRGQSVVSGREMTAGLEDGQQQQHRIDPISYIPKEMLSFPPNSLQALAVGWNLTGGKRNYSKRINKSRDKFVGKWRHWDIDGSRDIAEIEDIDLVLENWRSRTGKDLLSVIDWKGLRKGENEDGVWWEGEPTIISERTGYNQPSIPYSPIHPIPSRVPHRQLGVLDWGVYPEVTAEVNFLRQRTGIIEDEDILSEHIRPAHPRSARNHPPPPVNFVNVYETPYPLGRKADDWLREICNGDAKGEAYVRSVQRFIKGAMECAGDSDQEQVENAQPGEGDCKVEEEDEKETSEAENGDRLGLDEYIYRNYHSGILSSGPRGLSTSIAKELTCSSSSSNLAKSGSEAEGESSYLSEMAKQAYARIKLRELTSTSHPMDIQPLLRQEDDFIYSGVGGKSGVQEGLNWVGGEIARLVEVQQAEREKSQKSEKEEVQKREEEEEEGTKRKRAEEEDDVSTKRIKLEAESDLERKKMDSSASSPLSAAPDSPKSKPEPAISIPTPVASSSAQIVNANDNEHDENEKEKEKEKERQLRKLRLELVALSKFYPLPALKKMTKEDAERLLPLNVRVLMSKPT